VRKLGAAAFAALAISLPAASFAQAPAPAKAPAPNSTVRKAVIPKTAAPKTPAVVEPEARQALERMTAYLGTLKSFEITSTWSLDLVTMESQRIQLDGVTNYKVRRPDRFIIDVSTAQKKRRYIYDGKTFVLFSPDLGFYSRVPAPPTNAQTMDLLWTKYGIELPLEDLFRWNDPEYSRRADKVSSGFDVGPATVDGVEAEQYAFRQGQLDWQVWIQKGSQPLPIKVMIVSHADPANPAYVARLSWKQNPELADTVFDFKPGPNARPIRFATAKP